MSFFNWGVSGNSANSNSQGSPNSTVERQKEQADFEKSVNESAKGGWTGISQGTQQIAAVFMHSLSPANRQKFFEDLGHGLTKGLSSSLGQGEGADSSFVKSFFSGARQLTATAMGEITGIALRELLSQSNAEGLDETDKDLLKTAKEDLEKASQSPKKEDQARFCQIASDMKSLLDAQKTNALNDQTLINKLKKNLDSWTKLSKSENELPANIDPQALYEAGLTLSKILTDLINQEKNGEVKDKLLQKQSELISWIRPLRPLYVVAQDIREQVSKYHVIMGGFDLSILLKWQTVQTNEESQSINPISSILTCQEKLAALKTNYNLPIPQISAQQKDGTFPQAQSPNRDNHESIQRTDQYLDAFCKDISHLTTMKAVDRFFGIERQENVYHQLLKEKDKVRKNYASKYTGLKKYFVHIPFLIIHSIVAPLITKMLHKLIGDIRGFLKDEHSLIKFADEKIADLSNYLGSFELQRQRYLKPDRTDNCGTFIRFCATQLNTYGSESNKFTEEELLHLFKEYIIQNYTPRPQFAIQIPLLTSFFTWIIFSIRKSIIGSYLKKSKIIETYLQEGTSSIQLAQLGVKRLLIKKLDQLKKMMDETAAKKQRSIEQIDLSNSRSFSIDTSKADDQRSRQIHRKLHKTISEFSGKVVRFIDIEACNGKDDDLRRLDNRVNNFFQELKEFLRPMLPIDPFSLSETMGDAISATTENAIASFFQTDANQVEEQIQGCIELVQSSITYNEQDNTGRAMTTKKMEDELITLNDNLKTLTTQLSESAVSNIVNDKLERASGERHKRIVAFVLREKEQSTTWANEINIKKEQIQVILSSKLTYQERFEKVQTELGLLAELVEGYLRHISSMLSSEGLKECYSDVQKDLFSSYKAILNTLTNQLIPSLAKIAEENKKISNWDEMEQTCQSLIVAANDINPEDSAVVHEQKISRLIALNTSITSHSAYRSFDLNEQITILQNVPKEIAPLNAQIAKGEELNKKAQSQQENQATISKIDALTEILTDLKNELQNLPLIKQNKTFKTNRDVDNKRIEIKNKIVNKITNFKKACTEINNSSSLYTTLKPLLEINIQSIEDLNDEAISKLNVLLIKDSVFGKEDTLFTKLTALKAMLVWQNSSLKTESPNPQNIEHLKNEQKNKIRSITEAKTTIQKKIQNEIIDVNCKNKQQSAIQITEKLTQLNQHTSFIDETSKKIRVKGYITLGEYQLKETLSPKILEAVIPQVQSKVDTLISSTENDFHWKQLVLRLILADFAGKQRKATGR